MLLRTFTVAYADEIDERARRIAEAQKIVAELHPIGYRSNVAELRDAAIGSCAVSVIDVVRFHLREAGLQ